MGGVCKKTIIPFHLEDFELIDEFKFHLPNNQRIDAYDNYAEACRTLLLSIRNLLAEKGIDEPASASATEQAPVPKVEDIRQTPVMMYPADMGMSHPKRTPPGGRVVQISTKSEKVRCPLCRSSHTMVKDEVDDLRVEFIIVCIVGLLVLAASLVLFFIMIEGQIISMDPNAERLEMWMESLEKSQLLLRVITSMGFEGDLIDQISKCAISVFFMALLMLGGAAALQNAAAKAYRVRVDHAQLGMEKIPYKCSSCNEKFTVMVPIREKE